MENEYFKKLYEEIELLRLIIDNQRRNINAFIVIIIILFCILIYLVFSLLMYFGVDII